MADRTTIEWTDATWNPVLGCTRAGEECRNCYAEIMAARFSGPGQWGEGLAQIVTGPDGRADHRWTGKVKFRPEVLDQPLRWRRPRRIFVCSTSDLFHPSVPDEWIDQVFAVMALAPQHTFQVLTKRPERMREYFSHDDGYGRWGYIEHLARQMIDRLGLRQPQGKTLAHFGGGNFPHVWLGTSIADQATADARIPHLLATPAAVRFVSAEPLLGPVDIAWALPDTRTADCHRCGSGTNATDRKCPCCNTILPVEPALDWVIVGGESGPGARPMHQDWARSVRDQCIAAGVPFLFKQWGEWGHALHMPGVEAVSAALAAHGHWAHPHRYRIHGGPEDGQCFESLPADHMMLRVGKKASGRRLDGREWNEVPHG